MGGDTLIEYSDYYDYTSSYPEGEEPSSETPSSIQDEVELDALDDTGYQLHLPSGATIGHRSLARYYKHISGTATVCVCRLHFSHQLQGHRINNDTTSAEATNYKKKLRYIIKFLPEHRCPICDD